MDSNNVNQDLEALKARLLADLEACEQGGGAGLEDLKVRYLGKKGEIYGLMRGMGALPADERPAFGQMVNTLRDLAEERFATLEARAAEQAIAAKLSASTVDPTLPGTRSDLGHLHPLTLVRDDTIDFFRGMGFELAEAPEVDHEWYNFEALNIPPEHPARDMHDTFYVDEGVVMRTHTSNVQVHYLLGHEPGPVRMLAPGCVYRVDNDASHAPMFQQVECLVVDENVSFSHLKGVMLLWAEHVFGKGTRLRVRPSYFPFTEPSAEVDVSCSICGGTGCRLCKQTGWIEVGGCGSVDPAVFAQVGWDPERWTGFAFGFGIDRIALLKYGIPNIGLLTKSEVGFLRQF
jgi:phenylalanyl-tRNA synthetase alpha chain